MARYSVEVARPIEFLAAMAEAYSGRGRLSLEGDLGALRGCDLSGASLDETPVLRRNTLEPQQDFTVIPLTEQTLPTLVALFSRIGLASRVLHIQIESRGALVLGAYDCFAPECTWVEEDFGEEGLERLRRIGVLRSFAVSQQAG
jgi:hypothetical protein